MKTLALIAALTAVTTSASADTYNENGNLVIGHGQIIVTNPDSSYQLGDRIFKKNVTEAFTKDGITYTQNGNFVQERDKNYKVVTTVEFDHNNNAVIDQQTVTENPDGGSTAGGSASR